MNIIQSAGTELDEKTARAYLAQLVRQDALSSQTASLILSGISDSVLTADEPERSVLRANIFKAMLLRAKEEK